MANENINNNEWLEEVNKAEEMFILQYSKFEDLSAENKNKLVSHAFKMVRQQPQSMAEFSPEVQFELIKKDPMLLDYSEGVYIKYSNQINAMIVDEPRILSSKKFVGRGHFSNYLNEAVEKNPMALEHAQKWGVDTGVKIRAVIQNPECIKFIPKEEVEHILFTNMAKGNNECFKYLDIEKQKELITQYPNCLEHASREIRNDDEIVRGAVSKNPLMYQYASDRLRDDAELQRVAVNGNFNVYKMLPQEAKQNPEFEPQRAKVAIVDKFVFGAIKLEDIDKQNFVDINFYNTIVEESKNKVLRQFDSLTQGMEMSDKVEEKLQTTLEKKLKQIEKKLEHQRNWALVKNGIKTKIDEIKDKFDKGFEAGQVANLIKNMEL